LKENINLKEIKDKVQNNKIEIKVLRSSVYDLWSHAMAEPGFWFRGSKIFFLMKKKIKVNKKLLKKYS
jgi:hypothetical protein